MARVERSQSVREEKRRPSNDRWIIENADALFKFASTKFQIYGCGVVFINRRNILKPPRYIPTEEIKKENLVQMKEFVDRYDPSNSFVISFDQESKRSNVYRVNLIDLKQKI